MTHVAHVIILSQSNSYKLREIKISVIHYYKIAHYWVINIVYLLVEYISE